MWRHVRIGLSMVALLAACASGGTAGRVRGRPDLLTEEQIRATNHSTLYDVVRALRPNWTRTRGPDSLVNPGQIQVYLDDMRLGGVEELKQIPATGISYVQWYDGIAASGRWGLDHGNGVIYVATALR